MADCRTSYRKAPSWEIKQRARALAYLNDTNKIMTALANEYGVDRPLPSRAYIDEIVERRRAGLSFKRRDTIEVAA